MEASLTNINKTTEYFWRALAVDVFERDGIIGFSTGINNKYLNSVFHRGHDISNIEEIITAATLFYEQRNLPWTWDTQKSADFDLILKKYGFSIATTSTLMVCDLTKPFPMPNLSKYDIKEVESPKEFEQWSIPLMEGFESSKEDTMQYQKLHQRTVSKNIGFHHYLASINEEPITSCTISMSEYGARIDDIVTRTKHLRQGFATAIMLYAMGEAKHAGYTWCCLDASSDGLELYKKLGFKTVGASTMYAKT